MSHFCPPPAAIFLFLAQVVFVLLLAHFRLAVLKEGASLSSLLSPSPLLSLRLLVSLQ